MVQIDREGESGENWFKIHPKLKGHYLALGIGGCYVVWSLQDLFNILWMHLIA